ncbi:putative sugar epimerase [Melioribacter roseus P3M-2]|uniref:dTDP-4-dehydrorhamnose 3,5-epimerase n=1 Tax=Melioribacter roseus (strain DSM 23840 / JCM 17771 / VKM B-2668 / P3M-2) TaxID=1191523 RepID=I6ZTT5_MELRP|nr:dTDP-4-dehydrorhamnose 3,5-epimerase family protein [Melioribacter roseus]AFN75409.1 putative sugar epimerase [Melioribacter roseus P3M-2]
MTDELKPVLIKGGMAVDDRGSVSFVNDFNFSDVKRFYMVDNHRSGFVRAWHAHKNEAKYVTAVKGSAIIGAVKIDNWDNPSKDLEVHRFVLSEKTPAVLYIPRGYANGFMTLTEDAKLIFYSTSELKESINDDYRYDARYWNPWEIEER